MNDGGIQKHATNPVSMVGAESGTLRLALTQAIFQAFKTFLLGSPTVPILPGLATIPLKIHPVSKE